jgi:hypothetical protein
MCRKITSQTDNCRNIKKNSKDFSKPSRWSEDHSYKENPTMLSQFFQNFVNFHCQITCHIWKCKKTVVRWGSVTVVEETKKKKKKISIILQTKQLISRSQLRREIPKQLPQFFQNCEKICTVKLHAKNFNVRKQSCNGVI